MVFELIEQLKRDWTDKYVIVDSALPELRRFVGLTGTVKTVNYSGRALVQFDGNNNIGWFDIDTKCLKIVDAPLPKLVKEEKAEKKAAPAAKAEKPAVVEKPAASGSTVADILAAARGGAKPAAPVAAKSSTADILAAARAKSAAPKAEVAPAVEKPAAEKAGLSNKSSTADILAALRNKTAAAPAAPKAEAPPKPAPVAKVEAPKVEAPVAEPIIEKPAAKPAEKGAVPKDTAGMIAYCRKTDGK